MVEDVVEINLYPLRMRGVDHLLEVILGAEQRVQGAVIVHVVAMVRTGSLYGRQPQRRDSHGVEIIELGSDAVEVADAVAV